MNIGTMISEAPFPNLPVLFKSCGLDFFIIDSEHGGFDYRELSGMIMNARLAGITCVVRLPDNQRGNITKIMDMGADAVLLPMTDSAYDILQVVKYAKYAPEGKRGISTTRAHTLYDPGDLGMYMKRANEKTLVFAQIETSAGLENIEDILLVQGVSGVILGPNDLLCDLFSVNSKQPVLDAVAYIAQAASKHKKYSGIITADEKYLACAKENNMDYFCVGSELQMLKKGCKALSEHIKSL